ncbi:MAG: amidohydrolase [Mycobacteriales bacterium]
MGPTLFRARRVIAADGRPSDSLIVSDGVIVFVGQFADAPDTDDVVNVEGVVLPAFVDAHVHLTDTGLALAGLDLAGARSRRDALDLVASYRPAGGTGVVIGGGWDESRWPDRRPPTPADLEAAAPGRAIYLARADVHSAVASPALLAAVPGIEAMPGWDPSGQVRRDAHHAVRAAAYAAVTPAQRRTAQRRARAHAASVGVAALHEMGGPQIGGLDDLTGLVALDRDEAGPRIFGYWGAPEGVADAARLGVGAGGDLSCDGALGSHTAALAAPYSDRPDTSGHLYLDVDRVAGHVIDATRARVQAGFHAIGDRALDTLADGLAKAASVVGAPAIRAMRHRGEHVEMAGPRVIETFRRLGVVASVQPAFDATWGGPGGMYVDRLGADRAGTLNPFAAFAAAGVPLAFGSDAPVTPIDPWAGVRAAVHHRTGRWRLSYQDGLRAATTGGWYAARVDGCGELRAGAPATFAAWSAPDQDEAGRPDLDAPAPGCVLTVLEGRPIYDPGRAISPGA